MGTEDARYCGVCGVESNAWVLICTMWPKSIRAGERIGVHLCPAHLDEFRCALEAYSPVPC